MAMASIFSLTSLFLLSIPLVSSAKPRSVSIYSQSLELVTTPPLLLPYRNGPIISASPTQVGGLPIYIVWYGTFPPSHRSIIGDFFHSLESANQPQPSPRSVSSWWSVTARYKDSSGSSVPSVLRLAGETFDEKYSLGKALKTTHLETLIKNNVQAKVFPAASSAIYFVLTSEDVTVEGFCLDSCGYHAYTFPSAATEDKMLVYAWVGNAASQCPGQCAWPFATPMYGPKTAPLRSPNANIGIDGMIINIATVLAGAATNPYDTGYYQGDAADPLEAVSACTGIFGKGAYPGYPGELLVHNGTGASYNAEGVNNRRFLVPAMWNPSTLNCVPI